MADRALIINGVPGSGKTTLSLALGDELNLPVLSKDAIKESLADAAPVALPTRQLGAIAAETLWSLIRLIDGGVIVESFWFSGRDDAHFRRGIAAAGVRDGLELWCEASPETTRTRFLTRPRHHAHSDAERIGEWESFSERAEPISDFPVMRVDTETRVDVVTVAQRVRDFLPASRL
jgi:predicted kinase